MTEENSVPALKEYFTACILAVATSFAGLMGSDGQNRGLWVVGLLALFMVIFVYYQARQESKTEDDSVPTPVSKLRRMSVLWYALAAALGGALVKELVQGINTAGPKEWTMSVLGLSVAGFSFRLIKIVLSKKEG